jgi:hypothetical protein
MSSKHNPAPRRSFAPEFKAPGGANSLRELYDGDTPVAKLMAVEQGKGKGASWASSGSAVPIQPLYEKLKTSNLIRNEVGAHYNIAGFDVSNVEVEEFGIHVLALLEAISCSSCKGLPLRKKPSWWECPCGACRSTPVERP